MSLRGAERRSNPKQKRDCHALRARNDCNNIYFVRIRWEKENSRDLTEDIVVVVPM